MFDSEILPVNQCLPFLLPDKPGYSFVWDQALQAFVIQIPNGELVYCEQFFNKKISDRCLEYFWENDQHIFPCNGHRDLQPQDIPWKNIKWCQDWITLYGKTMRVPRWSSWHAHAQLPYSYSGITHQASDWNKGLLYIKQRIESLSQHQFNSALLNWYRDGEDHISWHSDDEADLGVDPVVASLSLGQARRFLLRRADNHKEKIELSLRHGSLLIMRGQTQAYWQHSVPKQKNVPNSRINLTFRHINS